MTTKRSSPMKQFATLTAFATLALTSLANLPTAAQSYYITDLGTLGGASSYARGINDLGHVVGYSETAGAQIHGFIWQNGWMSDLGTLPGGTYSDAHAINNADQVVGAAYTSVFNAAGQIYH